MEKAGDNIPLDQRIVSSILIGGCIMNILFLYPYLAVLRFILFLLTRNGQKQRATIVTAIVSNRS